MVFRPPNLPHFQTPDAGAKPVSGGGPFAKKSPVRASEFSRAGREEADFSGSLPRFEHQDYAWALNRLRRAGATPTLAAIAREIALRDAGGAASIPVRDTPKSYQKEAEEAPAFVRQEDWKARHKEEVESLLRHEFSAKIQSLRERLETEKLHREELEKRLSEGISSRRAVAELEQEAARAHEAESLARERENALGVELENLRQEAAATREQSLLEVRARESEIQAARAAENEARARITELEHRLEEAQVDAVLAGSLENLINEQKLSLESTGLRAEALAEKLREASAKASRVDGLESSVVALQAEVAAWHERERHWRDELAAEKNARRRVEADLENERGAHAENLRHQIEEVRRQTLAEALEQSRAEFEERLADRLAEIRATEAAAPVASGISQEAWARASARLAELEPLEARLAELDNSYSALLDSRNQLQREFDSLLALRDKAGAELAEARAEILRLRGDVETANLERQTAREESGRVQSALETAQEAARQAAARLEETRAQTALLETRLEETNSALEQARIERDAAREQEAGLKKEIEIWQERFQREEARHLSQTSELETALAESRAGLGHLESLRTTLEARISTLEAGNAEAEAALRESRKQSADTIARAGELAESRLREIEGLRGDLERIGTELTALRDTEATLRTSLETHEKQNLELRETLAGMEARLQDEMASSQTAELRRQLDEHREALADARGQNQHLLERLEGTVRDFARASRPPLHLRLLRPVLSAFVFLALIGAAGYGVWQWAPHWIPSVEEMQKSTETFERLKEQNSELAVELNATLQRLQGAKQEEVTLAEMRTLRERLLAAEASVAQYEREAPANLARMTKLQSDLDLARSRLERISAELTTRDLKILELERLLGEAGAAFFQMPPAPRLALSAPNIEATLPGMPSLPDAASSSTELGDVAADSLRTLQRQAEEAWKAKNYGLAEVLFQRLTEAAPTNALAFSNLAAVQLELGKLSLAKSNIRRAIVLEPGDAFSHTTHGMILLRSGETEAARQAFLRAIELDPKSSDAFHYLGVAFDQQGDRLRAIEEVEKAVAISPTYAEAHFNLAVLHSQGGASEREKARTHYKKALELGADRDHQLDYLLE